MTEDKKQEALILLGNAIRYKRIALNLTQEELGERVGYGEHTRKQAISQIERGAVSIPTKKLNDFIQNLQLDATFFHRVNAEFSMGKYDEVIEMIQERDKIEKGIAEEYTPGGLTEMQESDSVQDEAMPTREDDEAEEKSSSAVIKSHHIQYVEGDDSIKPKNDMAILETKLLVLKDLLTKGLIEEEDFKQKKKDLLDKYL